MQEDHHRAREKRFGELLTKAIEAKGVTISKLAYDLRISVNSICQHRQGKYIPQARQLLDICDYLDVTPNDLLL